MVTRFYSMYGAQTLLQPYCNFGNKTTHPPFHCPMIDIFYLMVTNEKDHLRCTCPMQESKFVLSNIEAAAVTSIPA